MFLGFVLSSKMMHFLSCFACVVVDFWITKNVSGRYLVGLRWWSYIDEETDNVYVFESLDYEIVGKEVDRSVFWWGLIANTAFWSILFIINTLGVDVLYVNKRK